MRKHVLLVAEDDPTDFLLLERAVQRCGNAFQISHVSNGEELIQYLTGKGIFSDRQAHPLPDVLLLDLKMPRADGFDVLRWRQQLSHGSRLPVIVFSSSNLPADVERAYALGANSYVVKPSAPERLTGMVKALQDWWADFNVKPAVSFL